MNGKRIGTAKGLGRSRGSGASAWFARYNPAADRADAWPQTAPDAHAAAPDCAAPDCAADAAADHALRVMLGTVPAPVVPPGFGDRIVRNVTRRAQLPPLPVGHAAHASADMAVTGPGATRIPARDENLPVSTGATQHMPPVRSMLGGLAALAAGIAALAMIMPHGATQDQAGSVAKPVTGAVVVSAAAPPRLSVKTTALIAPGVVHGAINRGLAAASQGPAHERTLPDAVAAPVDTPSPAPEPVTTPASAAQLATATAPTAPMVGPIDDARNAAVIGAPGQIGPVLPQGYGFTGGGAVDGYGMEHAGSAMPVQTRH